MMNQSIIFNFHRVSDETDVSTNPFNYLSNISCSSYQRLIKILQLNASFVGLEDLLYETSQKNTKRPFLHLTFDDVSSSFVKSVLPFIEERNIPVTVFLSVANTERGYNWRDKIYFIMTEPDLCLLFLKRMKNVFGENLDINEKNIYSSSKDPVYNQKILEKEVVNNVLKDYSNKFNEKVVRFKPYLDWDDLSQLHGHPLVSIGNHGFNHYNYLSLCEDEIKDDIRKSHILIKKNLGVKCRHFAVPFGKIDHTVFRTVDTTLAKLGYETVGWVRSRSEARSGNSVLKHYIRIDGGQSALLNYLKFWKVIFNKIRTVL